jgi:hypothetical protein
MQQDRKDDAMDVHQRPYSTIKALVFDHVHRCCGRVDYDALTSEVKQRFPDSKWKTTHWAWYKSQIRCGRFQDLFTDEERRNLEGQGDASSAPRITSMKAPFIVDLQQDPYRTIKALVFDHVHRCRGRVDYDALTREVKKHFPASKWKETHWAWYSSQIRCGRFQDLFTDEERQNLGGQQSAAPDPTSTSGKARAFAKSPPSVRGPRPKDPEIKRIGDRILKDVRSEITLAAGDDEDQRFKINRWVFARLHNDEIRIKRPIKKKLWDSGMQSCQACSQPFASVKGVEIHRKDASRRYSPANCELLCRECHQELDD